MRDRREQNTSKSKQAHAKLDMDLFGRIPLSNEESLEIALSVLDSFLDNPVVVTDSVIHDLLEISGLFEFIISVASETTALLLSSSIVSNFPDNAHDFSKSLARALLDRFSLFLLFLPYPYSADEVENLRDRRHSIELAYPVLQALSSHSFATADIDANEAEVTKERSQSAKQGKFKSQRSQKKMRRAQFHATIDSTPFMNFGAEVPTNKADADQLASEILVNQKKLLQYFLETLRSIHLKEAIRRTYVCEPHENKPETSVQNTRRTEILSTAEAVGDSTPAAYPMVQPMKAALYFDSADGLGEWRILISTRADSDLRQMRKKNSALFKIVLKKIKELSNGHFSDDNQKQLTGPDSEIPIFEAKMTRDSRLVYHIDCVPEFESDVERQVIKIFGIYTHAQLDRRLWDGVGHQLGRKGKEYKRRCAFRNRPRKVGDNVNVVLPATFPASEELPTVTSSTGLPDLHKDDLEKLHEILVLEKYVIFSQALLNSIIADQDVAHVFDVSPQEKRIIEHTGSCYVLGRSGTGKTTTMLFKMLGIERTWPTFEGALPRPRQLFVTQSRVLAEKVSEFFAKLYESLSSADKSLAELRQLAAIRRAQHERGLVDLDEEDDWQGNLPKRFGEVQEEHFPLFLTFDQLCRLLEAEFSHAMSFKDGRNALSNDLTGADVEEPLSNDYMQRRRSSFVSYGVFLDCYWPHFPQQLTKSLDPALVFGEIMGVIKGSERTLESSTGYLDQDTYLKLSHRTQATFANQREALYKLFLAYLKRKRERREYDAADRTRFILDSLRSQGVPGGYMDFIYIDEAQDNLLIDALVLRTICRNPDNGLFWAGDTAQTISIGSNFRFDDLKAFLYRVEAASTARKQQPQSFQLAVNYRSHAGIVDCARSVVQLITTFWPYAIDNLVEEQGIVEGRRPVFLSGWDQDSVQYEQFLFGESGSQIEFGAQQCILVRDDSARNKLREKVGDIGLILTVYESKGLEFNDVLLYNFFADSTVDLAQWRVIFNALPDKEKIKYKAPQFDDARHNGLCRDLKSLYVAITRARQNLWIADSSEKSEPMKVLWTQRNQIQGYTPGSDVPRLATSSKREEWAAMGLNLFNHRRYMQAMHCYERAGMPTEKGVANAYYLREQARSIPIPTRGGHTQRAEAFRIAAVAFLASAKSTTKKGEHRTYLLRAAECYSLSGNEGKAADIYLDAAEYTLSARHYRKAGMFDEAVRVIKDHRNVMDADVVDSIIDVSRLEYLRARKLKKAMELFESDTEALEYMDDYNMDVARATTLENLGRFSEAAELHMQEGRTVDSIRLFLADKESPNALQQASRSLLDGLWRCLSLGATQSYAKDDPTLTQLISIMHTLNTSPLDDKTRDEISMFRAIVSRNTNALMQLGERFYRSHEDNAAALMCLDHAFSNLPEIQDATLHEVAESLQSFLLYVRLLQQYLSDAQPFSNADVRRLFGFNPTAEESFLIIKDTMLYERYKSSSTHTTDKGTIDPQWELNELVRGVLQERLRDRVSRENELCRKIRALQPCLVHSAPDGRCDRPDCPREHPDMVSYNIDAYNLRIRIYLQQVLIYNTMYAVEHPYKQEKVHTYWLRKLHEALHPPFYTLGTLQNLRSDMIREFNEGIQIASWWAIDWLYRFDRYRFDRFGHVDFNPTFLTELMRAFSLALMWDPSSAFFHADRSRAVAAYRPPPLMRFEASRGHQVYVVHDILAFTKNDSVSSLDRGIQFIYHVLAHRRPIDVGVLCNFLDSLCGMLIVSIWPRRGNLHGLTLPRSWLMHLLPNVERLHKRKVNKIHLYIKPMADVLEQMYTGFGADYLLHGNRTLSTLPYQVRAVFIARICRNICLLGYNIRDDKMRTTILNTVTSIRKFNRKFDRNYAQYVTARSWSHLASAVRRSTVDSSMDEMIQLHESSRTSPHVVEPPNVRRVVYCSLADVPALINSGTPSALKSALRAEAAPFIPAPPVRSEDHESSGTTDDGLEPEGDEEEDVDVGDDEPQTFYTELEDLTLDNEADDPDQIAMAPAALSGAELRAAFVILSAYRSYIRRHRLSGRAPSQTQAIRRRKIAACHEVSMTINWRDEDKHYKMLFLGPLPHLLLCLECTYEHLQQSKKQALKQLDTAVHQELEDVQAILTKRIRLVKEAVRLRKALEPRSQLHVRRDLDALKAHALKVEALMGSLPSEDTTEWQGDLKIAIKGICASRLRSRSLS